MAYTPIVKKPEEEQLPMPSLQAPFSLPKQVKLGAVAPQTTLKEPSTPRPVGQDFGLSASPEMGLGTNDSTRATGFKIPNRVELKQTARDVKGAIGDAWSGYQAEQKKKTDLFVKGVQQPMSQEQADRWGMPFDPAANKVVRDETSAVVMGATDPAPEFKGLSGLSTKIIEKLKGKRVVSKQFIQDLTNSGDVKQAERDLIRSVLDTHYPEGTQVFHGGISKFDKFDPAKYGSGDGSGLFGDGAYLTDAESAADFYAKQTGMKQQVKEYTETGLFGTMEPVYKEGAEQAAEKMKVVNKFIANGEFFDASKQKIDDDLKQVIIDSLVRNKGVPKDVAVGDVNHYLGYAREKSGEIHNYRGELPYLVNQLADMDKNVLKDVNSFMQEKGFDGIKYGSDPRFEGAGSNNYFVFNPEKTLKAGELQGSKISVKDLAEKVKSELLPLKVSDKNRYSGSSTSMPRYENISLPDEVRGSVANYKENIYESPIMTSAGNTHFGKDAPNYFGHTRIEDMADNQTRRVIEVQSDLYQKGNLEREITDIYRQAKNPDESYGSIVDRHGGGVQGAKNAQQASVDATRKLQQYNDPTAHYRMIREEVKKAAEDGKTKLQLPTGETAMKVEGLVSVSPEDANFGIWDHDMLLPLQPHEMKVGQEVQDRNESMWVITDVLGNGRFKAVQKSTLDAESDVARMELGDEFDEANAMEEALKWARKNNLTESFDISGKVDTDNPIYKFYEKEVGKYVKSKYGAKLVTDPQGVTWWEVDIKPEHGINPVEAFAMAPVGAAALNEQKKKEKK